MYRLTLITEGRRTPLLVNATHWKVQKKIREYLPGFVFPTTAKGPVKHKFSCGYPRTFLVEPIVYVAFKGEYLGTYEKLETAKALFPGYEFEDCKTFIQCHGDVMGYIRREVVE